MGPKILTVDDSKTIRMIIAKAFKPFDCEVLEASNGVEGLAMAGKERPDLIILDLTMPIMDGFETLTKLKSDPELKAIPVVMLTAEAGRENVLRIARQGVRDYLVKPFKEDLVVERVGRIIDLKPKGDTTAKTKRFDDPLNVLVVDDKTAIHDQVRDGLAVDTPWKVSGRSATGETVDFCTKTAPDVILISLSLPDNGGYTLFQLLRASAKTKTVPIFALCVKTATDEQARAQQAGFTGVVTKPIDFEDLKAKIIRTLSLDTSHKYFSQQQGLLVLKVPGMFTQTVSNDVQFHLRRKVAEAVDGGLNRMVMDLGAIERADIAVIKLGYTVIQLCRELSMKIRVVASAAVLQECRNYEETKEWPFSGSVEEALKAFEHQ